MQFYTPTIIFFLKLLLFFLFLYACGRDDDQKKFENAAFSDPDGFTRTNNGIDIIDGEEDPDDWRVAPMFQGLVSTSFAFPNPATTTDQVTIHLDNHGIDTVFGLRVLVYYPGDPNTPLRPLGNNLISGPLPSGLTEIRFQGLEIVQFTNNPQGLYRVIVFDGRDNVITYGDVKIE